MKSSTWIFAATLSISGFAIAQSPPNPGVTETTDPAKIAEIEKHAQELEARGQTTPAAGEKDHAKKSKHHKSKAKPKDENKDKAPADTPAATESKS
jgi:hypothetical protein